MRGSVKVAEIFGISINIHFTFLILPVIFLLAAGTKGLFLILFVFLTVVLHELCHSLQAKRYGIKVRDITLFPIGGIAALGSMPDNPRQELVISISGPLFNFILAALLAYPVYLWVGREVFFSSSPLYLSLETWEQTVVSAVKITAFLGVFNLIPAFPMDGGRVLRSLLAQRMDYRRATRVAVVFGHIFATIFFFVGIIIHHIFLVIIGVFIYLAASHEEVEVDVRSVLRKYRIKDILPDGFISLAPQTLLEEVVRFSFQSHQENFPVVAGEKLVGILSRSELISSLHQRGMNERVENAMRKKFFILHPADTLLKAHRLMNEGEVKALPVVDEKGNLLGIVGLEDISKVYMFSGRR